MSRDWRLDADCYGRAPLFDSSVDDETFTERVDRLAKARHICETCPVKVQCVASVDYNRDEGVRGGIVLARLVQRGGKSTSDGKEVA